MKYNFDNLVNRKGSFSSKWEELDKKFHRSDLLPMWVADMDFKSPKPVIDAIIDRATHGIFGYTSRPLHYYEAIINWLNKRHDWEIKKDWIAYSPGVLPAISSIIQAFTHPGDKIIIQPPVYYPFSKIIKNTGRHVIENCLYLSKGKYYIDFKDLENKALDSKVKIFLLCNPHNPVGRVWEKDELLKIGDICLRNNILIVSDEIHSDIIFKNYKHIPIAKLSQELSLNSITCFSPSKTFNLAGLQTAAVIIPNTKYFNLYDNYLDITKTRRNNIFGLVSLIAAYNKGEEWLNQLLDYLQGNLDFLIKYINRNIPQIKVIKPEGTYLVWLDCRELGLDVIIMENLFINKAKVALDSGYWFGTEGDGFMRINIACPRSLLKDGLNRIRKSIEDA